MNHAEYKTSLLADPAHPSPEMREHVAGCPDCDAYTERLLRFENRLARALEVAVPEGAARVAAVQASASNWSARSPRERRLRRGLAVAASVLVAVVAAGGVWLSSAGRVLASDVVGHMAEEPNAWLRTEVPVPEAKLEQVMAESHLRLKPGAGLVSYANSCGFRGHQVPHLVVQTDHGPVTVMVLTHESVHFAAHFDEQGYRGMIVPVTGHGSLAVLDHGAGVNSSTLDQVATGVLGAIEWNR
jgi:hypothetical protein